MKSNPTLKVFLFTAALLAICSMFLFAVSVKTVAASRKAMPAEPKAAAVVAADDDYYKIPGGVGYQGMPMTNKAGLLTLSTELGQNYYLVNDTAQATGFLYAELKADNYVAEGKERLPLNICLVIDRSGSMEGDKLENVKKAANFLIDRLNEKDVLSIVLYESNVGVVQKPIAVTDKKMLHGIINEITAGAGTNLGGGMMEGYNQVKAAYRSGVINRVLLLSDGLANEGIIDPVTLQGTAKKWFNAESISISTFGVGNDYNENLMTSLAENGGGNYYYIKDPEQIPVIFEKEIKGLLSVVAQQAKLTFNIPQGISILRVYGGNYEMDNGSMTINLKDIFANETKAILIKYKIKKGTNTELPFATKLGFEDATNNNSPKAIQNLNVMRPVTDPKMFLSNFSERVMQQCTIFEANDMLEKAMKAVDERDFDKARKISQGTIDYSYSNCSKFNRTKENDQQDSIINIYNSKLKNIETKAEYEQKEIQKSSKCDNYSIRNKKQ